jgi:hypothetical protein
MKINKKSAPFGALSPHAAGLVGQRALYLRFLGARAILRGPIFANEGKDGQERNDGHDKLSH